MNRLSLFTNPLRALARRIWSPPPEPVDTNRDPLIAMCDNVGANNIFLFPNSFAIDFPDPFCRSRLVTVSKSGDGQVVSLSVGSVAEFKANGGPDELKALVHLRNKPDELYEWRVEETEHGVRVLLTYTTFVAVMNADLMLSVCTTLRNEAVALDTDLVKCGII